MNIFGLVDKTANLKNVTLVSEKIVMVIFSQFSQTKMEDEVISGSLSPTPALFQAWLLSSVFHLYLLWSTLYFVI